MNLDLDILNQLKNVFTPLTDSVILEMSSSGHEDQKSLQLFLEQIASTNTKISLALSKEISATPYFYVNGIFAKNNISFRGIPGGHEFSSLVLAILAADGKAKLPDTNTIARIKNIRGPVKLRTFVSLSCENCPDVVQSLNLIASIHGKFSHEAIDGGIVAEEVEKLGIQGVPSVMRNVKLFHSGKSTFIDLIEKLENHFGTLASSTEKKDLGLFDITVIGGGPAGLSAAIYSARKGLKTAIIAETIGGQLRETKGIENMISQKYTEGAKLSAEILEHAKHYPIEILEHRRVSAITPGAIHSIELKSNETIRSKSIIIATGAKWRQLGIPGEKENIGSGVAYCAHCDGPFYKNKRVAVVGGGNSGIEAAIDLSNIATHVTLLEFGENLKADNVLIEKAKSLSNVKIITKAKSNRVLSDGKKLTGLEYEDRNENKMKTLELDGVFVQIGLLPNSEFVKDLVETTPSGEIKVDARGHTNVPGIYAAGDVTTIPFKQIIIAMGDGAKVALSAFEDLLRQAKNQAS